MSSDAINKSKMQIAKEIIHKVEEFIHNEQAFSQDYYISATEPLMQLEELLVYLRLLPWPKLVEMIEKDRNQLFEWAHIGNGERTSDANTICEAKGRTKGIAMHLANVLREGLAAKKPSETGQKNERSKIMVTARTSKDIWEAIKSEYDTSKRDFGKKINFVSDSFKRKIIFRDIEHAFVLASHGFSKPALILAGGVIEELLRLYLKRKRIKPKNETFFAYIEACEDNKLLKRGVYRLSDSIRDFRNLVHLENEKTKRHTVSKATAKGAVSSIFTIANDFQ